MMPPDTSVELTLDPRDATSEVIVTAPAVHLTIRADTRKERSFRVRAARLAGLVLEYSDHGSNQPHLYRRPQEKPSATPAILWAPKGMRVLVKDAAALYVTRENQVHLFIKDGRDAPT